jgi:hypothetical protein
MGNPGLLDASPGHRVYLKNEVGYEIFAPIHDLFARCRSLDHVGRIDSCDERRIGFRDNPRCETYAGRRGTWGSALRDGVG